MRAQGKAKQTQKTSGRREDELTETVEGRPHFAFWGGLDLEQVLAYRNCGGSTAFFFRSEPGTGARPRLQKLRRVDRIFLLFFGGGKGLNLEQVLVYRKCGTFFLRSEPGTGASLQKMWHFFFAV